MDLVGFALAVLLIELTPGPNMAWLISLSLSEGRRAGLAAITGIAAGLASNAAISVLAASFVLQQSEWLSKGIAVLGAAMMTWLAWEAWRKGGEASTGNVPKDPVGQHGAAGFMINLLNPKAALFFITVMPQFVAGGQPTYVQALTFACVSVAIATLIHLSLVFGAEPLRPLVMARERAATFRRILAVAMLGVGAWFIWKAFF